MFIRIWHKPDNVGSDDPTVEEYVALSTIRRFYSRRYPGDVANRYIVSTGTDNPYITKETFDYLKSLRGKNVYEKGKIRHPDRLPIH